MVCRRRTQGLHCGRDIDPGHPGDPRERRVQQREGVAGVGGAVPLWAFAAG